LGRGALCKFQLIGDLNEGKKDNYLGKSINGSGRRRKRDKEYKNFTRVTPHYLKKYQKIKDGVI